MALDNYAPQSETSSRFQGRVVGQDLLLGLVVPDKLTFGLRQRSGMMTIYSGIRRGCAVKIMVSGEAQHGCTVSCPARVSRCGTAHGECFRPSHQTKLFKCLAKVVLYHVIQHTDLLDPHDTV